MKFNLVVNMDNAAFVDDPNELSRILKELANKLEQPDWTPHTLSCGAVRDLNGNGVGGYAFNQGEE